MKVEYLFPTFIIKFPFDKHDQYKHIFDHLTLKDIEEQKPKSWTAKLNTNYNSQSNLLNTDTLDSIRNDLNSCVLNNLPSRNFSINNFWYNIYKKDYYQETHNHCDLGVFLSAIYFHKNSTSPRFISSDLSPIGAMGYSTIMANSWFSQIRKPYHQPNVSDGEIIVFPADLLHEVPRYQGDNLRITFSFNYSIVPPELM